MLSTRTFYSIQEIDPEHWDSILDEKDIFHRHAFIEVVEKSKVENADFFYLACYDKENLVATAVFSAFYVNLDLFISNGPIVRRLKKIFPRLFRVKILACGLPVSFGQSNLKIADEKYAGEITARVASQMDLLARQLGISLMTIKEFRLEEKEALKGFGDHGYFEANSIPYMNLEIRWNSFDAYLDSLRHSYRRRIRLSLEKLGNGQRFTVSTPSLEDADRFYKMYLGVMERTPVKLETLNLAFFRNLFENGRDLKLLSLVSENEILSSAVLCFSGEELIFILAGRMDGKDRYDSYFNLVYEIIKIAIDAGVKRIKMGQTSYWLKQCVGALPEREYIYFKSRRSVVHGILKKFRHAVFPEMKFHAVHIFNSNTTGINKRSSEQRYEYSE